MSVTATVHIAEFLFGALTRGGPSFEDRQWTNNLVLVLSAGAVVSTGIFSGNVQVTADPLLHEPAEVDTSQAWDLIVEVSVAVPSGELRVASMDQGLVEELPELAPNGPGSYRLRIHTRGR